MDYTQSNSYDTDAVTGHRMHEVNKAIPTVVSDDDMNSIIWSLMEVLKAGGIEGQQFNAAVPASYSKVVQAINSMLRKRAGAVCVAGGTANAITGAFDPVVAALTDGMTIFVRAAATSTTATPTFKADATAAKTIVAPGGGSLRPGDIAGAGHWLVLIYDATLDKFVLQNPASSRQIQSITAAVAANALTIALNPTTLDFRSTPVSSGGVNARTLTAASSLTVPSGATLGTANGVAARLLVLAIDNAGAIELAVVNMTGGLNLDETGLISTTAISAAATSSNVIYAQAARASVPYRVVGFIDSTQAAAGTWATAPSTVQGAGGVALAALQGLGYGQAWQNVLGSRALNTSYTNTTGRPIVVSVSGVSTIANSTVSVALSVNGLSVSSMSFIAGAVGTFEPMVTAVVPPGASYYVGATQFSLSRWSELR